MMVNCPTCGREVPTLFEHVDVSCGNWPDRGEQLPQSYRGYGIDAGWFMGYDYIHDDYDGPEDGRCGNEATLELCYRAIDERLDN
jgi:hypothetical protein